MQNSVRPWGWLVVVLLNLNIFLGSASAQGKLPSNTRHLPKDATAIISVRIGDLLKKGGYEEFLQSDLVKMAKAEMVDNELALEILDDPEASGIDLGEPIHIFIKLGAPAEEFGEPTVCLLYTSPSPRDRTRSRMPSSA